jgi:ABC-type multidrug transport system fused ATPase/permease subunit
MTTLLTVVVMLLNSPLLTLPLLVTAPLLIIAGRRYLKRAPKGYITEGGTYSQINSTFTETVEGARTVEALGLQRNRIERGDEDIAVSAQAERYTMSLRNLLFIVIGFAYDTPLVMVLILGGIGYANGWVSLGQITAATLYVQALVEPLDRLIRNVDRLQVGIASTCRLLGIAAVPQDREAGDRLPLGNRLIGRNLRFAYYDEHDVLHGIDLALRPGERLAIVGPSGSGKSTLGRLMAGINKPRTGSVTVGGVELTELPLPVLRTEVALVTQEHHVFVGTVRDNIILARESSPDDVVIEALRTVDAWDWVERLPQQLGTMLGSGHQKLTPAQAQQVALARLVVADPHTLVLDEATSLIDPHTARHLEGSMAALLEDRTVVAIAHRLHTAHDADRIAVVINGQIVELGSHQELVAANGEYARLWRAWTS